MTDPLYRQIVAQLERDRTRLLAASDATTIDEVRIAQSGIAAGYLHAIALTLRAYEGPDAAQDYLREHVGGESLTTHEEHAA